jgi:hypothetical protein
MKGKARTRVSLSLGGASQRLLGDPFTDSWHAFTPFGVAFG